MQLLGRGLLPRLSIGTLQLSIRCSSIHFLPSRSLRVSFTGGLDCSVQSRWAVRRVVSMRRQGKIDREQENRISA